MTEFKEYPKWIASHDKVVWSKEEEAELVTPSTPEAPKVEAPKRGRPRKE